MEPRIFYRVANNATQQGLWYDFKGNFTGLIHDKFKFCLNNKLPMPFDEDLVGWLSAAQTLGELFMWFPPEDILRLEEFGYSLVSYEAADYRVYKNHWVINQQTSRLIGRIPALEARSLKERYETA